MGIKPGSAEGSRHGAKRKTLSKQDSELTLLQDVLKSSRALQKQENILISLPAPWGPLASQSSPSPMPHALVFQASGACRSEVFTAQEAKAQKTRHMSLWVSGSGASGIPAGTRASFRTPGRSRSFSLPCLFDQAFN